jgi:hypothetical protein
MLPRLSADSCRQAADQMGSAVPIGTGAGLGVEDERLRNHCSSSAATASDHK